MVHLEHLGLLPEWDEGRGRGPAGVGGGGRCGARGAYLPHVAEDIQPAVDLDGEVHRRLRTSRGSRLRGRGRWVGDGNGGRGTSWRPSFVMEATTARRTGEV